MLNERQLLELVEYLSVYSDSEDVDMDEAQGKRITKRERRLATSLNQIYCAVHGHSKTCPHANWQKDATEQYTEFVKMEK